LTVASTVSESRRTTFASMPARPSVCEARSADDSSNTRAPANVPHGISWMLRPGATPVTPSIDPNCEVIPASR